MKATKKQRKAKLLKKATKGAIKISFCLTGAGLSGKDVNITFRKLGRKGKRGKLNNMYSRFNIADQVFKKLGATDIFWSKGFMKEWQVKRKVLKTGNFNLLEGDE